MRGKFFKRFFAKQNSFAGYQLCTLPRGAAYFELSAQEAKDNFDRFVHMIPERIDYLTTRCAGDLRMPAQTLDMSPESLVLVWRWFLQNACVVDIEEHELTEMQKHFGHLGASFIGEKRLSAVTEFVLQDIGMYLGETFVRNCASIHWELCTKPKNSVFINRPVLAGFGDNSYTPPFRDIFEPAHMASVQAAKLLSGVDARAEDLYHVYMKWEKYAHG